MFEPKIIYGVKEPHRERYISHGILEAFDVRDYATLVNRNCACGILYGCPMSLKNIVANKRNRKTKAVDIFAKKFNLGQPRFLVALSGDYELEGWSEYDPNEQEAISDEKESTDEDSETTSDEEHITDKDSEAKADEQDSTDRKPVATPDEKERESETTTEGKDNTDRKSDISQNDEYVSKKNEAQNMVSNNKLANLNSGKRSDRTIGNDHRDYCQSGRKRRAVIHEDTKLSTKHGSKACNAALNVSIKSRSGEPMRGEARRSLSARHSSLKI
jgi:hypothetical protein